MNYTHFSKQVKNIYQAVNELEAMFPGRPFTPDGHMIGSISECLVIKIHKDGTFTEVYNGAGNRIWQTFKNRKLPSNGQFQISLSKLEALSKDISISEKIPLMVTR